MHNRTERIRNILIPVISVILGLLLGALLMFAFGYDPILGYEWMLDASLGTTRVWVKRFVKQRFNLYGTWIFSRKISWIFQYRVIRSSVKWLGGQCLVCSSIPRYATYAHVAIGCFNWSRSRCSSRSDSRFLTCLFWNE